MSFWRFFARFFLALCVGCIAVLYYAHYDEQLLYQLQQTVAKNIEQQFDCYCSVRVRSFNLLFPEFVLEDILVSEHADAQKSAWSWKAQTIGVRFSWLYFLLHGAFDLKIHLHNVAAYSVVKTNGRLPLLDHITAFFVSDSPIPVIIKEIILEKSTLILAEPSSGLTFTTTVSGSMASLPDYFKLIMYSNDGTVVQGGSFMPDQFKVLDCAVRGERPSIHAAKLRTRDERGPRAKLAELGDKSIRTDMPIIRSHPFDFGPKGLRSGQTDLKTNCIPLLHRMEATTLVEIPYTAGASSTVRLTGSADVVAHTGLPETLRFSGTYNKSSGTFSLSNADGSCAISSLHTQHTPQGIVTDIDGCVSLKQVTPYVSSLCGPCNGNAIIQTHVEHTAAGVSVAGTIKIVDAAFGAYPLGTCVVSCNRTVGQWHGSVSVERDDVCNALGEWSFNEQTKMGQAVLTNQQHLSILGTRFWAIQSHEGHLECSFNAADTTMQGTCRVRATNEKIESSVDCVTQFTLHNSVFTFDGGLGTNSFQGVVDLHSASLIQTVTLCDETGVNLITFKVDPDKPHCLQGDIAFPLLKKMSKNLFDLFLGGQGVMRCVVERTDTGCVVRVTSVDSTIRLLQTNNFIRDMHAVMQVDVEQRRVQINDFLIQLQKGSLHASCCTLYFDEYGHCTFAHAPLFANKLFLNINKDMFVVFSGSLLGSYSSNHGSAVVGSVTIDRGQVMKNIFSSSAQKNLLKHAGTLAPFPGSECAINIAVNNKAPLHVKTSVLDAHITCNGSVTGTVGTPHLTGGIDIVNGTLMFPYRSLPIVSGKLSCSPFHGTVPAVDLVARGKVKKYHVTLRVDGTVSHPRINFESSPPLTEEQIITLLLSGSDDGSLALAMPALVMHNVQNILFGDEQTSTSHDSFVKNMLKPLKMIRIVPNFSDQQARGGIRGSLIIDLDERFHALIQKNFSLPEDTRFEVEYHVSDDMTVRAIKDEHSDLGGEVEMRWKF